jgi:plastocyanin
MGWRKSSMSIKVGDTIRYAVTDEEGEVVALYDNTSCVAVRFGDSFTYLIAAKELELVAGPTTVWQQFS